MALLVGELTTAGTEWTYATADVMVLSGFTPVQTGTAANIYIWVYGYVGSPNIKLAVYDASGNLLSGGVTSGQAVTNGVNGFSISCTITTTNRHYLGFILSGDEVTPYHDGSVWNIGEASGGSYASPPASITPFADEAGSLWPGKVSMAIYSEDGSALYSGLVDGGALVGLVDGGFAR